MYFKFAFVLLALSCLATAAYALNVQQFTHVVQTQSPASTTSPKIVGSTSTVTTKPAAVVPKPKLKPKAISIPASAPTKEPPIATSAAPLSIPINPAPVSPAAPSDYASLIEADIHMIINAERAKQGLSMLSYETSLSATARAHSTDMLTHDYFNHTDLNGCSMSCRFQTINYHYWAAGENIYMMQGYTLSAEAAAGKIVDGWMNSPGHRANILNASFTTEGIGIAAEGGLVYATEDLAKPR